MSKGENDMSKKAIDTTNNEIVTVFCFQFITVEGWHVTEWAPNQYLAARYARGIDSNPYRVID
jgi:hypothetical protein